MPKYIDAEKLRNELYDADAITFKGLVILNNQPTIDITRCKECIYWVNGKDYEPYCNHLESGLIGIPTYDDFCSYGERKTK